MITGEGNRAPNSSTDWSRFGAPASRVGASSSAASAASFSRMVISSPAAPSTMSNSVRGSGAGDFAQRRDAIAFALERGLIHSVTARLRRLPTTGLHPG